MIYNLHGLVKHRIIENQYFLAASASRWTMQWVYFTSAAISECEQPGYTCCRQCHHSNQAPSITLNIFKTLTMTPQPTQPIKLQDGVQLLLLEIRWEFLFPVLYYWLLGEVIYLFIQVLMCFKVLHS